MANFGTLAAAFGMPGPFELLILAMIVGVPIVVVVAVLAISTSKKTGPPMAGNLTPCPDCGNAVSIRAQTCPHCGALLKPTA